MEEEKIITHDQFLEELEKMIDIKLRNINSIRLGEFIIDSRDLSTPQLKDLMIEMLKNPEIKKWLDLCKTNKKRTGYTA